MKTIILAGGIAAAALCAGVAAPASAADFTGPRIEAHVAWDRVGIDNEDFKLDDDRDGIAYGVGVGYDVALGKSAIAGVEASFDLSNVDFAAKSGTTTVAAEAKRDIELAARVGAKVTENVLLYAKAGYSNARVSGLITTGGTTGQTKTPFAENLDGIRVGGGVELALGRNAYAKAEYRYTNYEGGVTRHQALTGLGFRF